MHRAVVRRGRPSQAEPPVVLRPRAVPTHTRRALAVNRTKLRPAEPDRLFEAGRPRVWHRRGLVVPGPRKLPAKRNGHAVVTPPAQAPLIQPAEALEKVGALARSAWTALTDQVQAAEVPEKVGAFARSAWSSLTGQAQAMADRLAAARAARPPKPALPKPASIALVPPAGVPVGVPPAGASVAVASTAVLPVPAPVAARVPAPPRPATAVVQRARSGLATAPPSPRADGLGCVHTGVPRPLPVTAKVSSTATWVHRGALGALVAWSVGLVGWLAAPAVTAVLTSQAELPDLPPIGDGRVVAGTTVWLVLLVFWAGAADWHDGLRRQAAREWLAAQCEECRYQGLAGRDLDAFTHPSRTLGIAAAALACLGLGLVGLGVWRAIMGPETWAGEIELMICSAIVAFVLAGGALRTSSRQGEARYRELLDLRLGDSA